MSVQVHIERFEGPLGLLLHLIRKEEMDIFDINIHEITRQYLEYIKKMKELNLELAGEFIAMAATLIHIKSKMLLPQYNEEGEEEEAIDPRKELVQRLVEYQTFQEASQRLYALPLLGRDVWARGRREVIQPLEDQEEEEIQLEENPLFALILSYRTALKNMKRSVHRVGKDLPSIGERVRELKNRLIRGIRVTFSSLMDRTLNQEDQKSQILVTFLSLLELGKLGFVRLFQSKNFEEIYIETLREVNEQALQRVEDYEGHPEEFEAHLEEEILEESHEISPDKIHLDPLGEQSESGLEEDFVAPATDEDILEEEQKLGLLGKE
ncbi:MAG: hypothetical protein D6797_04940 [Bdellovibrio sp.]|nr:MAG: hypothetical protein D6797_04940 [Bdellovibrio sp.]